MHSTQCLRNGAGVRRLSPWVPALAIVLAIVLIAASNPVLAAPQRASMVVDAQSGEVLHASSADAQVHPASLTKIMTLYMVFKALDAGELRLDDEIEMTRHGASMPPSRLGLSVGSTISVHHAILALVTKSANDVAAAVGDHLGGSESNFAREMTAVARGLRMSQTVFVNASGLPDNRQITTARDMIRLAFAMRAHFPHYYHYFSEQSFRYSGATYQNHNRLLGQYPGTDGLKTGYIRASGFNLVATVERDGRRLVGVVFGGSTGAARDAEMMRLFDAAFTTTATLPATPAMAPERLSPNPSIAEILALAPPDSAQVAAQFRRAQLIAYGRPGGAQPAAAVAGDDLALVAAPPTAPIRLPAPTSIAELAPMRAYLQATTIEDLIVRANPEIASAGGGNCISSWGIQVGAFGRAETAGEFAQNTRARLLADLSLATIAVGTYDMGDVRLYRSMLFGLDEETATRACAALADQSLECVPIAPQSNALELASIRCL